MKKLLTILIVSVTIQANAGLFVLGMSIGNPVLAIPMVMAGGALTINAVAEISTNGWTTRNAFMLALGLLALDDQSGSLDFNEVDIDQARLLNVSPQDISDFNRERSAMNAFNQTVLAEIARSGKVREEQKLLYAEIFSEGTRRVSLAISQLAIKK